jgi:hypothetical protein
MRVSGVATVRDLFVISVIDHDKLKNKRGTKRDEARDKRPRNVNHGEREAGSNEQMLNRG